MIERKEGWTDFLKILKFPVMSDGNWIENEESKQKDEWIILCYF